MRVGFGGFRVRNVCGRGDERGGDVVRTDDRCRAVTGRACVEHGADVLERRVRKFRGGERVRHHAGGGDDAVFRRRLFGRVVSSRDEVLSIRGAVDVYRGFGVCVGIRHGRESVHVRSEQSRDARARRVSGSDAAHPNRYQRQSASGGTRRRRSRPDAETHSEWLHKLPSHANLYVDSARRRRSRARRPTNE